MDLHRIGQRRKHIAKLQLQRLPLFAFAQCLFGEPAVMDVDVHAGPFLELAVGIEQRCRAHVGPAPASPGRAHAEFGVDESADFDCLSPLPLGIRAVIGMDGIQPAVAHPFLQALPGVGAPAGTVGRHHPVRVAFPYRLRQATDQVSVPHLALAQGRIGLLALGDVLQQAKNARRSSVIRRPVEIDLTMAEHPERAR
ncbi:hypothetical protein XAUC_04680 [Xanthomonas citri pv. aurantifolii str. ICPB 10535]|nr:hypothetical protein XAUC_04680 [Xanthomonas citri pv. aurantifolii str. ICPB 10535]